MKPESFDASLSAAPLPGTGAQQIHLFVEQPARSANPLPVPAGISCVDSSCEPTQAPVGVSAESAEFRPRVEPVVNQHGHVRLWLVNSANDRVHVNGAVAPLLAVLKERDFVQFEEGCGAYISVLNRPRIGPPPPHLLGRECPVCRVKFAPGSKCYQCPCGAAFHMEDADGLQCAQTRTECTCGRPTILVEGFSYQPDLNHA